MTRNELIRKLKDLDFKNPVWAFYIMKDFAREFDPELNDFFDGYMGDTAAISYVYNQGVRRGLAGMYRCLECTEFSGVYTTDCDGYLVDVDLPRLRDDLINRLLLYKDDEVTEPVEDNTDKEAVWVDEEDDFLTKENKQ